MHLDPIDFFPAYDRYVCCRRPRSTLSNYEYYKKFDFEDFRDSPIIYNRKTGVDNYNLADIKREMIQIKESLADTDNWRNQLLLKKFMKHWIHYASTYACGVIISTPDTFPYPANKSLSFFHLINVDLLSNPEAAIQPANFPGNCFAFYGSTGRIRIKLGKKIHIKAVTMDHIKLIEDASSAPKDFEVFGLYDPLDVAGIYLGRFRYNLGGRPYQTFAINPNQTNVPFEYVELYILSNYGRREFTCVYRFRVHNMHPGQIGK
ncbi:hypothetical protein NQ315_004485 [Exocentrus adspersus]|uniref:SUN domain-containing protein n=1 Tax=Exocentrus adspersus TaxID=1586481 RepID=A0AAV8VPF9_9CUCU|nr:hypothetical protein NQ315_004485 [Exocentrus adspersus]